MYRDGSDNRLQYSCLENPMDREVWWVAVYGVTQSQTLLKQLSSSGMYIYRERVSIPGLERSPGGGNVNQPQYVCLENSMDRKVWWATVYGVAKSRTRLSD